MYHNYRKKRLLLPVLVALLCVATFAPTALCAPQGATATATAVIAGVLCSPEVAVAAAKDYVDFTEAVPAAQTFDENDYDSGFWTQMPTEQEIQPPTPTTPQPQPETPPEGMVPIVTAQYAQGSGATYVQTGTGSIRNLTELSDATVASYVGQALPFSITPNSTQPQVLIMHTHATECYEQTAQSYTDPNFSARTTDTTKSVVAVGQAIADELNAMGVMTLHDATLHDYPSYNGSYGNSHETVCNYLAQYPSIKVVLDVHRDALQKQDGTRIKPVVDIDGKQAAQVMIIAGCDNGGNLPNYTQNLKFAARLEQALEGDHPGLTRPVLFDYRYYNQDLTTGSLLLEMGGHANTLEEALYSATLVGKSLGALLLAG